MLSSRTDIFPNRLTTKNIGMGNGIIILAARGVLLSSSPSFTLTLANYLNYDISMESRNVILRHPTPSKNKRCRQIQQVSTGFLLLNTWKSLFLRKFHILFLSYNAMFPYPNQISIIKLQVFCSSIKCLDRDVCIAFISNKYNFSSPSPYYQLNVKMKTITFHEQLKPLRIESPYHHCCPPKTSGNHLSFGVEFSDCRIPPRRSACQ